MLPRTHHEPCVRSWERRIVGNVTDYHVVEPASDHECRNVDPASRHAGLLPKGVVGCVRSPGRVLLSGCRAPIVLHSWCRRLAYVVRDPPGVEVPQVSVLESELRGDRDQMRWTRGSRLQGIDPSVARSFLPNSAR